MSEIIRDARRRIDRIRRKKVEVVVLNGDSPVQGAEVTLTMKEHQFLFGCDCYCANTYGDAHRESTYRSLFAGLFNYATLPFYWNQYEPAKGQTQQDRLAAMEQWCRQLGLVTKGHPLVWNTLIPDWLTDEYDMERLIRLRIEDLVTRFGQIDFWDVFNEITTMERYDNPVSRWIERVGKPGAVEFAVRCVHQVDPKANLLYNDYNIWPADMETLLHHLRNDGVELSAVGLQSHMHQFVWDLQDVWDLCERYARFGWPLHFTETTVLSCQCKPEIGYNEGDANHWITLPGDLERQQAYTLDLYTLLFSHPAVEAVTWWDFPDNQWLTAPGGLVTEDLRPKPVYHALVDLIKRQWWSSEQGTTDLGGCYCADVFCGNYDVAVTTEGKTVTINTDVLRDRHRSGTQKLLIRV